MDTAKGQIVVHGGFDSFIEEFYFMAVYFSNLGYEVIMFEGLDQGATLKKYDIPLTHEWEKPIKAILDYFNLENVTLIGYLWVDGFASGKMGNIQPYVYYQKRQSFRCQ